MALGPTAEEWQHAVQGKNNRLLLTFPWQCPANALPSSGTLQGFWSLLQRLLIWMRLLEGVGENTPALPKVLSNSRKLKGKGLILTPVAFLAEDLN